MKIRTLAERRGFTQETLAEAITREGTSLGITVSRSTVGRWFRGESLPSMAEAWLLSRVASVDLTILADPNRDSIDPPKPDPDRELIEGLLRRLDPKIAIDRLMGIPPETRNAPGPR